MTKEHTGLGDESTTETLDNENCVNLSKDLSRDEGAIKDFITSYWIAEKPQFYILRKPVFENASYILSQEYGKIVNLIYHLKNPYEDPPPDEEYDQLKDLIESLTEKLGNSLQKSLAITMKLT